MISTNYQVINLINFFESDSLFQSHPKPKSNTNFLGIADIITGTETDEFNFTPCGYSMNGLTEDVYSTIHVTPEPHCSYASYETNISLSSYRKLVMKVFDIFRPGTVTLSLFAVKTNGSSVKPYHLDMEIPGYHVKFTNMSDLGENCEVIICNYESVEFSLGRRLSF